MRSRRPVFHWFDEELGIAAERPASSLEPPGAEAVEVEVPGVGSIVVIAIEDLVCDRLASWAATGHYDSWAQAVRLAHSDAGDQERLEGRVADLGLDQYLRFALWLEEEVRAGRGDRSAVARYVHSLHANSAAAVITDVLRDRADVDAHP